MAQHTLFGKEASRVPLPPSQRNMTPIPSKEAKHGLPHVTGTPKFFPRLPPWGPASWVVWHLPPHYLLSFPREARGRDQPGSCLRCWLGWWGMWAKGPPKSRAGAKELGELWASLPPHSTPQREPPWGLLCQGAENRPPLSSARGQAQPTWLSTHPPGGRGKGGTREGAGPLLGPPGQDKFSAGLRACGTGSAPAVAAPCNLTLGSPGQPATKKLKPR